MVAIYPSRDHQSSSQKEEEEEKKVGTFNRILNLHSQKEWLLQGGIPQVSLGLLQELP